MNKTIVMTAIIIKIKFSPCPSELDIFHPKTSVFG